MKTSILASQETGNTKGVPGADDFDVQRIRADFPILQRSVRGKPLIYFDNAATAQKPAVVIDSVDTYYRSMNANINRGVHYLGEQATLAYDDAREKIREFINAEDAREIVFVRGTTEAVNLIANTYGRKNIGKDDEIVITAMEHHSNIVPWQLLCEATGAKLRVVPITDDGELRLDEFEKILSERTKLVSVVYISNALGTVNAVKEIIDRAHRLGIPVMIDGAQSTPHCAIDVRRLDCDFYAFSGHKLFGPNGIGVLYGKVKFLDALPPFQGGGDMIRSVTFERTTYKDSPHKFEAGTPNISGAIGLGAAVDYVSCIGMTRIAEYERYLLKYATDKLAEVDGIKIIGTAKEKAGVISFVCDDVHPHDIGTVLDLDGIAIRAGHHCTQPLMERLGLVATARASFSFYNTFDEIDYFIDAVRRMLKVFKR